MWIRIQNGSLLTKSLPLPHALAGRLMLCGPVIIHCCPHTFSMSFFKALNVNLRNYYNLNKKVGCLIIILNSGFSLP